MACRCLFWPQLTSMQKMSFQRVLAVVGKRRNMNKHSDLAHKGKKIFPHLDPSFHICWMVDYTYAGLVSLHPWQSWLLYWSISMLVVYVGCSFLDYLTWCLALPLFKGVDTECFWGVPSFSGFFLDTGGEDGHWFWHICSRAFTVQDFSLAVSCLWLDDQIRMFKQNLFNYCLMYNVTQMNGEAYQIQWWAYLVC